MHLHFHFSFSRKFHRIGVNSTPFEESPLISNVDFPLYKVLRLINVDFLYLKKYVLKFAF